jgi:hypothetical protein
MALGNVGYKSRVAFKNDAGQWVEIFQPAKITPWSRTNRSVDMSHLQSPDFADEKEPGPGGYDDASFDVVYQFDNPSHQQLLVDSKNRKKRDWRIQDVNPNTDVVEHTQRCIAWIKGLKRADIEREARRGLTITLEYLTAMVDSDDDGGA